MVAKKYRDKALAALDSLELTGAKRERLLAILDKAYRVF
jgi:geranylgeranyl pyrophosphate synthase